MGLGCLGCSICVVLRLFGISKSFFKSGKGHTRQVFNKSPKLLVMALNKRKTNSKALAPPNPPPLNPSKFISRVVDEK